jgi:ketosteroid isomerase-like protein
VDLGRDFARALAAKDAQGLLDLLHPDVEFRAVTPGRSWEADDREAVLAVLLGKWFEPTDEIEAVERVESDAFADRQRVGYRFRVSNPEGSFLVEQQAYLSELDGRIGWMRVVCSGYRPLSTAE